MKKPKTYTTSQVARLLGIGRDTIYRWMRAGKIKGAEVTRAGNFQIRLWTDRDMTEIRRYVKQHYMVARARGKKKRK